jgi:hypothetical protein
LKQRHSFGGATALETSLSGKDDDSFDSFDTVPEIAIHRATLSRHCFGLLESAESERGVRLHPLSEAWTSNCTISGWDHKAGSYERT